MKVGISSSFDLAELAADWTDLEDRADGNFFLSWRWIGTWLGASGARPVLVKATENGRTIALGLLTPCRRKRHFLSINQLCLHETGVADSDSLTIEYNGFLTARGAAADTPVQILRALQSRAPDWDEIVLSGIAPGAVRSAEAAGLHVETDRHSPVFGVDLAAGPWEERLSPNLRAQIRQSRAYAERSGPLTLTPARDTDQAVAFFEAMAALHTAYWQGRNRPGAFATHFSQRFHRELIAGQSGLARVELLQLAAGSQIQGYLYNFHYAGTVCNYQSGFAYDDDNRHRPGLLAHAMAITQAQRSGMLVYDFLAGDAPYKARLGGQRGIMAWCRAQRDRPLLRAERTARRLYQGLRGLGR
ncbi:MAG TPA: GNAT family N-acetyltransferase, partial [Rhizomicrobium sp.]|nr:GNAT family N-acetyltransferase [Rhizomicrobium sp.]